ncbi:glycosyltransferase family 4 protein [soil metagenome]
MLPGFRIRPIGGFLVVYRYANELAKRGHGVSIVHPRRTTSAQTATDRAKAATWATRKRVRYRGGRPSWFDLDRRVNVILTPDLQESRIPDGDAIFATACNTARYVWDYPRLKGAKLYLIQGFEDWVCGIEEVEATWKLPMHKVVISQWLYEIGVGLGERERLTHVPNGVDLDNFRELVPPRVRSPMRVGLLAHDSPVKGMRYGIEALKIALRRFPEIEAVAFGTHPRPSELPTWVHYYENPSREELVSIYNSLAIFLHTSEREGWGLTGAEAVACGCALVATDSGGIRDYAIEGETALLVRPRDATALAARMMELVEDMELRTRLAESASSKIKDFTWDRAASSLEGVLSRAVQGLP